MEIEPSFHQAPRNFSRERLRVGAPLLAIAFIFLFSAILQGVIHACVLRWLPQLLQYDWYPWTLSMLPMYAVAMPLSLLLFRLTDAQPPQEERMKPMIFFALLALCFGFTYLGNFIGMMVNFVLGLLTGREIVNELAQTTLSSPFWVNLLYAGILAPILEEVFYRKLVIDRLRVWGELPAVLISGIAFGLVHGNFSQFFYAAMLGIVFGYIYLRTGNIKYTVGLHMAINLVGGVFSTELSKRLTSMAEGVEQSMLELSVTLSMFGMYGLFLLALIPTTILSAVWLYRHWFRAPIRAQKPLRASEWRLVLLYNPAVWLFLVVVVMLFL